MNGFLLLLYFPLVPLCFYVPGVTPVDISSAYSLWQFLLNLCKGTEKPNDRFLACPLLLRKKENMSAQRKASINEKRLFHGTSPNAVEAICKQNFDWRLHGKTGTMYGEGSYFALNSSYSDCYAPRFNRSSQFMFVAKVLVGSYTKGESSYRRPPAKDPSNPASDLYDSCVDNTGSPSIFVIFDTDQFYPEYIVEYFVLRQEYGGK